MLLFGDFEFGLIYNCCSLILLVGLFVLRLLVWYFVFC